MIVPTVVLGALVIVLGPVHVATAHGLKSHEPPSIPHSARGGEVAPPLVSNPPAPTGKSELTSERRELSVTQVQERLAAVPPLQQAVAVTSSGEVKTTVLCYCLAKAPETVRELRRLAAKRFAQGIVAWQAHQFQDAITAFTKTLQLHPRNTWAYVNRGLAYARLGQHTSAQADFTRALDVDPQLTTAYYARGLVSLLMGHATSADRDLQHAAVLGEPEARDVLQTFVSDHLAPVLPEAIPAD